MTGDEIERAIQFLLESQAKIDAQIGQLGSRVDQLTGDVAQVAGGVAQLTGDVSHLAGLVGRLAESTRLFVERANGRFERLETAMSELTERLNAFIGVVERHVTDDVRHRRPSE